MHHAGVVANSFLAYNFNAQSANETKITSYGIISPPSLLMKTLFEGIVLGRPISECWALAKCMILPGLRLTNAGHWTLNIFPPSAAGRTRPYGACVLPDDFTGIFEEPAT